MSKNRNKLLPTIIIYILILNNLINTALADEEIAPLNQAIGEAFIAKAELSLLKGQHNTGKVYLFAAYELNPSIPQLKIKAIDMMNKDFPFVHDITGDAPDYRYGACAVSANQRFLAYHNGDEIIRLDLNNGQAKILRKHNITGHKIYISPNGKYAAFSDNMGNMSLIDFESEKPVGHFSFREEKPRALYGIKMSFSPDETTIAAYYEESEKPGLYFLKTEDLSIKKIIPTKGHVKPVRYLSDSKLLLGIDRKIKIFNPSTMQVIKTIAPETGWDADYLPEKNLVVVGGYRWIKVFNTRTLEKVAEYQGSSHNNVLVRFLSGGRYIVYASPKNESGIIDCSTGKPVHTFQYGRDAAVSTDKYILFAQGKVINLSACRTYEQLFDENSFQRMRRTKSDVPYGVQKALDYTSDKSLSKTGGNIYLSRKSPHSSLEAFGTYDGRTFLYDHAKAEKENFEEGKYNLSIQVGLLTSDSYRRTIDLAFIKNDSHLLRLGVTGNSMAGSIETYCLKDCNLKTLRMDDPPVKAGIVDDFDLVIFLDRKNRVFLSEIPELSSKIELLPATQKRRQIYVGQKTNMLVVKTEEQIDSYDLIKVSKEATIPSYQQAVELYGISLEKIEPLWSLVNR